MIPSLTTLMERLQQVLDARRRDARSVRNALALLPGLLLSLFDLVHVEVFDVDLFVIYHQQLQSRGTTARGRRNGIQ
jgi:hypothetical protein